ncbi:hypothetical protein F5Y18DRAFT_425051 [Xylariaceae sp. FL1019]|nr:hypothetical protein F5Y18DRAFT_425051 [Xylariaceae sp. FL1019]
MSATQRLLRSRGQSLGHGTNHIPREPKGTGRGRGGLQESCLVPERFQPCPSGLESRKVAKLKVETALCTRPFHTTRTRVEFNPVNSAVRGGLDPIRFALPMDPYFQNRNGPASESPPNLYAAVPPGYPHPPPPTAQPAPTTSPPGSADSRTAAQTVPSACLACRSKHLKCDGSNPCSRCLSSNSECVYIASRRGYKGPRKKRRASDSASEVGGESCPMLLGAPTGTTVANNMPTFSPALNVRNTPLPVTAATDPNTVQLYRAPYLTNLDGAVVPTNAPPVQTSIADQCLDAFYFYFYPGHPVVLPKIHLLKLARERNIEVLLSAIRWVGSDATTHGGGNPRLEESWRRTWWDLFVVDGMIAGVHRQTNFLLFDIVADVGLPCEEQEFLSGKVPRPMYLEDFDDQLFTGEEREFSSFAYRVASVRNLGRMMRSNSIQGITPEESVDKIETLLSNWRLHLPRSKRDSVYKDGQLDEMMFQAHMINHACSIILHQPLSQLDSSPARDIEACAPYRAVESRNDFNQHTRHIITAACEISKMVTYNVPITSHTHFFTCVLTLSSIVHLSKWALYCIQDEDDLRQQVRLNIGALNKLSSVWKAAENAGAQVKGVAQEIYRSRKVQQSTPSFWVGFTQQEIISSMSADEGIMSEISLLPTLPETTLPMSQPQ